MSLFSIQLPKLSFSFPRKTKTLYEWQLLDIQLKKDFIDTAQSPYYITEEEEIRSLIKLRKRFAHKGNFRPCTAHRRILWHGRVSILSARACLCSGVGLLTVHVPIHNHDLLQTTVPEAIVQTDIHDHYFAEPVDTDRYRHSHRSGVGTRRRYSVGHDGTNTRLSGTFSAGCGCH